MQAWQILSVSIECKV